MKVVKKIPRAPVTGPVYKNGDEIYWSKYKGIIEGVEFNLGTPYYRIKYCGGIHLVRHDRIERVVQQPIVDTENYSNYA